VLHGEKDPLIRFSHAEHLVRTIPDAQLTRLARCGHFPQEECPEAVARAIVPFLERCYPLSPSGE
jgi:pimeloyl-ACP methyl ester carboxylesterase